MANSPKLKPLGNRVIVQTVSEEETSKSGIILPDTVDKEKKAEGKIVAVGDGERIAKLGLKIGDRVLFGKYAGEEVTIDKIDYKILTVSKDEEGDVLAVVER